MPTFAWQARTRAGEKRRGRLEAQNETEALAKLKAQNLAVTKIRSTGIDLSTLLPFAQVSQKELVVFTRQLSTMIDAGLPIVQCLDILQGQTPSQKFKRLLLEVKADVEAGSTFSQALRKHPRVFDDLYTNLVAAGEAGGILDRILSRLAGYAEKAQKLRRQIKGAMIYPTAIVVVAILVVVLLLWKVIPVFEKMFKEMGGSSLPAPTQFVIDLSRGFQDHFILFGMTGVGLFVGGGAAMRHPKGRRILDAWLLKAPLVGPLLVKAAVARFTRTLGTLLSSGVAILDSMDIVSKTAGNAVIADAILVARQKIAEGKNMSEPLLQANIFPPMVVQMIGVGEQTGALDAMLQKIADFYEEEVDAGVTAMTKLMEPIMMVVLGGIVGGLLIAMYLPIFEMAGQIK